MNLRVPGPTPCRQEILDAVGRQMMNHRGPQMEELLHNIETGLQSFLETKRDFMLLSASGTGGLEAAVVNTLSPGDRVLSVSAGAFGNRFRSIAEAYGADVFHLDVDWGRAADPERVCEILRRETGFRAVLLTHNETSTGVTHPLRDICGVIRAETDSLILVDAVSSLGAVRLPLEEWGIDLVVTGSQKAWGVPPGVAMVGCGGKVWEAYEQATMPRFYLDLARYREASRRQYPFTPALSVLYGLEKALALMLEEGPEAVYERHARVAARTREGVRSLGLRLFADERFASNTVTAVWVPDDIDGKELLRLLREKYDTVLGGGQAHMAGRLFRIGHLGWVREGDVGEALSALKKALADLGFAG
jgi:aspartate aminotransferase-like enzyme